MGEETSPSFKKDTYLVGSITSIRKNRVSVFGPAHQEHDPEIGYEFSDAQSSQDIVYPGPKSSSWSSQKEIPGDKAPPLKLPVPVPLPPITHSGTDDPLRFKRVKRNSNE